MLKIIERIKYSSRVREEGNIPTSIDDIVLKYNISPRRGWHWSDNLAPVSGGSSTRDVVSIIIIRLCALEWVVWGERFDSVRPRGFRRRASKEDEAPDRICVTNVKDHWDHCGGVVGLSFVSLQCYRALSGNILMRSNVWEKRKTKRKPSDFLAILHARYTIRFFFSHHERNKSARASGC